MELFEHQKQVLEKIKDKNKCALYLDMRPTAKHLLHQKK